MRELILFIHDCLISITSRNLHYAFLATVFLFLTFFTQTAQCWDIPYPFRPGNLQSNNKEKGEVPPTELWKFSGEKGERVILVTTAREGQIPPDIFLFKPRSSNCETWKIPNGKDRFLIIDHILQEKGDYVVMVRNHDARKQEYHLVYAKLSLDGTYKIDPDSIDVPITSSSILPEKHLGTVEAGAFLIVPYLFAPFQLVTGIIRGIIWPGIGLLVEVVNFPGGMNLYQEILDFDPSGQFTPTP